MNTYILVKYAKLYSAAKRQGGATEKPHLLLYIKIFVKV